MELLILILKNPVVFISIIVVIFFKLIPPKKINSWYGYRTANSIKNKSKWDFAQSYNAKLSLTLLFPLLLVQISFYYFYGSMPFIDLSIVITWFLTILFVIYKTEKKLKD